MNYACSSWFRCRRRPCLRLNILPPSFRVILPACALLLAGAAGLAVAGRAQSGYAPMMASGGSLEFRGVLESGSGVVLGFFDRDSNLSYWVPVNGAASADAPLVVRSYNKATDQANIEFHGRPLQLTLVTVQIAVEPALPDPTFDALEDPAIKADKAASQAAVQEIISRRAQRQTMTADNG